MNSQRANEAMDKIRDEMAGSQDDGVQVIGEAMTALLQIAPELTEKVLAKGKTCAGAFGAVRDYAKKNKGKGTAVYVPPAKAAEIVAGYWEIPVEQMKQAVMQAAMASMGGETQAHAGTTPQPPYGGSSPCTGEPMAGMISPVARGGHGGISAAAATSMLDDFDALLGGL